MKEIFRKQKTLSLEGNVGRLFIPTILDIVKDDDIYSVYLKNSKDKIVLVPNNISDETLSDELLSDCCEVDIKKVRDRRLSITSTITREFNYSKGEEITLTVYDNGVMEIVKIK